MADLSNLQIERIHPSLWKGSQLARATSRTVETGYPALSAALSGGGWPRSTLVELVEQQAGVGELRLLAPALAAVATRPLAFLQPPQTLNAAGPALVGIPHEQQLQLLQLLPARPSDALWTAEQVLRAGTCGALVFWQQQVLPQSLRRLHLAARTADTLSFKVRPLFATQDASRAELRLALRPAARGVSIEIMKRRGPVAAAPIVLLLRNQPVFLSQRGPGKRRSLSGGQRLAQVASATNAHAI